MSKGVEIAMHRRILLSGGAFAAITVSVTFLVAGQQTEKRIEVEREFAVDPVVVTAVTRGNSTIECGLPTGNGQVQPVTPFQAGTDWLQNTTVQLYNQTDKTISFLQLTLVFPETGSGTQQSPLRISNINLGRIPTSAAYSGRTGKEIPQDPNTRALSLKGHDTLLVDLGAYIKGIRESIDNVSFESISKCEIRRSVVYFEDGMKWAGGGYSQLDPKQPGKFYIMPKGYFPGDRAPMWPGERKR